MESFVVSGRISGEMIAEALRNTFPDKKVTVIPGRGGGAGDVTGSSPPASQQPLGDLIITPADSDESFQALLHRLEEKEKALKEAEVAAHKAVTSIQALHKQQQALFDEFVLLRQRYDDQKQATVNILWKECARYHPELREVPMMEDSSFTENEDQIGRYLIGDLLGEGQFAAVRACMDERTEVEYAIKMIKKDRITSFTSLTRVSNEIDNLRQLKSPYVISVVQVIHTASMLYLVTEKGGSDLFEFFDEHPDGVPEPWAREIISNVLRGVLYCHEMDICHRDLKPENILLTFDPREGRSIDLKLCDFGLSTKFKPKQVLTDFCGSPGFFAPEMILHGCYYGDKVDVWSIGCILLELVLGHEKFCDVWMTAYDYEVLQDKDVFTNIINETVEQLSDYLNFSAELNAFILQFLNLHSSKRPTVRVLAADPWLEGILDPEVAQSNQRKDRLGSLSPMTSLTPSASFLFLDSEVSSKSGHVNRNEIAAAYNNISDRERRHMEEYIQHHKVEHEDEEEVMKLPPITPATPNIVHAKKILRKGNELAGVGEQQQQQQLGTMSPSPNSSRGFFTPSRSPLPSVAETHDETTNNELTTAHNTLHNGTKRDSKTLPHTPLLNGGEGAGNNNSNSNGNSSSSSSSGGNNKPSLVTSHSEGLLLLSNNGGQGQQQQPAPEKNDHRNGSGGNKK